MRIATAALTAVPMANGQPAPAATPEMMPSPAGAQPTVAAIQTGILQPPAGAPVEPLFLEMLRGLEDVDLPVETVTVSDEEGEATPAAEVVAEAAGLCAATQSNATAQPLFLLGGLPIVQSQAPDVSVPRNGALAPVVACAPPAAAVSISGGKDTGPAASAPEVVLPDSAASEPVAAQPAGGGRHAAATTVTAVERSLPAAMPVTGAQAAASAHGLTVAAAPVESGDTVLKLPNGAATQWRQPLVHALGERLQVELGRGAERAVIRLDPPMMGTVEIVIRHEAGSLQVQLSATHGEVLRQLQTIGDALRQDLVHRQYTEVSVQVSDGLLDGGGRQGRGQQGGNERGPGRALGDAGGERTAFVLNPDQE